MRRSASEIIRNLESRIARLENKSAGYPQGYFDSNMYDAERSYYEDDYFDQEDDYGYAAIATITARDDKRVLNQAGKRLGCMITKVKEAKEIHMVCNGSKVLLKVQRSDDSNFVIFVNGKKVSDMASGYWGDIYGHTGGSDRDLQNRYVEFLKKEVLPYC